MDLIRLRIASTYMNTGLGVAQVQQQTEITYVGSTGSAVGHHPEVANVQVPHDVGDTRKID